MKIVLGVTNKFSSGFPCVRENGRDRRRGTQTSYECELRMFRQQKGVTEFATKLKYRTVVAAASCSRPRFVSALHVSCSRRSTFRFPLLSTSPVSVPLQAHLHGCLTCVLLSL
ncbi:hypothetical protein PIB30_032578 [Stylosanthes scabra]|uniref:Uncharacterized protein n=1 Tax=Stylosanthes scabra TaxID=79078 RepID=A0ABU6SBX2_9FABA|nr:hypothetical protein [Stylosanthes scabra]